MSKIHLSFQQLRKQNVTRCEKVYHKIDDWTATDWACAVGGECGELLNVVKKIRRTETGLENFNKGVDSKELVKMAADEMGDIIIYLDLLAARMGIDLSEAVINKFNKNSEEAKSDIFL